MQIGPVECEATERHFPDSLGRASVCQANGEARAGSRKKKSGMISSLSYCSATIRGGIVWYASAKPSQTRPSAGLYAEQTYQSSQLGKAEDFVLVNSGGEGLLLA